MGLAEKQIVIRLAGSPSLEYEQTVLDIDDTIERADRIVYEATRKSIWLDGEHGREWAVEAANKWAAAQVLQQWGDSGTRSDLYKKDFDYAMTMLRKIGFGSLEGDNPTFVVGRSQYKAIGMNKNVGRYISNNAFGGEYE